LRRVTVLLIAVLLFLAAVEQAAPAPPAPAAALSLDPRWSLGFDGALAAAPGYDPSTAYVALKAGELVAVDLDRGAIRWRRSLAVAFTPEAGGGRVFVVAQDRIEALDAATGATAWRTALPGEAAAPLYWDTGWLLASTTAGDLAAFRANDGTLVWRQTLGAPLAARPAPALDRLFVALTDGRVLSLMLATGDRTWERTLPGRATGVHALDDQVLVGSNEDAVYSFDTRGGRQRWRWRVGGDVSGSPNADDRHIYFATRDNVLRAVDRRSGNLRWTSDLPSRPIGGPLLTAGAVLVPSAGGVAAFDAVTGKPVTVIPVSGEIGAAPFARFETRPTAARLITLNREGQLQGFGLRFEPKPGVLDVLPGAAVVP
jgi:outer membrane protein assembly factor BamB